MAAHKSINNSDLTSYLGIENGSLHKRKARKIFFSADIEQLSDLEENFNERDSRILAGEMKPRRRIKGHDSDEVSSDAISNFDSEASRVNFWKDINTRDD